MKTMMNSTKSDDYQQSYDSFLPELINLKFIFQYFLGLVDKNDEDLKKLCNEKNSTQNILEDEIPDDDNMIGNDISIESNHLLYDLSTENLNVESTLSIVTSSVAAKEDEQRRNNPTKFVLLATTIKNQDRWKIKEWDFLFVILPRNRIYCF